MRAQLLTKGAENYVKNVRFSKNLEKIQSSQKLFEMNLGASRTRFRRAQLHKKVTSFRNSKTQKILKNIEYI